MKVFYVQLMSNASSAEFPSNTANSFKNRLPYPLRFKESGWKVVLASLTYPIPPSKPRSHHQTHIFEEDDLICRFRWSMKSLNRCGNIVVNRWTFIKDLIQPKYPITGGKSLMKYIVNEYQIRLRKFVTDG